METIFVKNTRYAYFSRYPIGAIKSKEITLSDVIEDDLIRFEEVTVERCYGRFDYVSSQYARPFNDDYEVRIVWPVSVPTPYGPQMARWLDIWDAKWLQDFLPRKRTLMIRCPSWNHPYSKPYCGLTHFNTHWAPRFPWLCTVLDWLTKGGAHD